MVRLLVVFSKTWKWDAQESAAAKLTARSYEASFERRPGVSSTTPNKYANNGLRVYTAMNGTQSKKTMRARRRRR